MGELINLIKQTIVDNVGSVSSINIGQLPLQGGLSMQIQTSEVDRVFLNKNFTQEMDILFLIKSKDQQLCLNTLDDIKNYLNRLKVYPNTSTIEWVNANAQGGLFVDKEDTGFFIYSMVTEINISYF